MDGGVDDGTMLKFVVKTTVDLVEICRLSYKQYVFHNFGTKDGELIIGIDVEQLGGEGSAEYP